MKITKQVLKKMIKEELKQVQTNEGAFGAKKATPPDVANADRIMDSYKPLLLQFSRINTMDEVIGIFKKFIGNLPAAKKPQVVKALRVNLKNLLDYSAAAEAEGGEAPEHAAVTSDGATAKKGRSTAGPAPPRNPVS